MLDRVTLIATLWGRVRTRSTTSWWPYQSAASGDESNTADEAILLTAVPYFTWGNREPGAMRVWIPADT